jgi:hypothetical protein
MLQTLVSQHPSRVTGALLPVLALSVAPARDGPSFGSRHHDLGCFDGVLFCESGVNAVLAGRGQAFC